MTSRLNLIVLPREDWEPTPRISVYMSLYLEAGVAKTLGDLAFARAWPQTVRGLSFNAYLRQAGAAKKVGRLQVQHPLALGEAMSRWQAMVADGTPLGPTGASICQDPAPTIQGYDVRRLCDAVDFAYAGLREKSTNDPTSPGPGPLPPPPPKEDDDEDPDKDPNPLSDIGWWTPEDLQPKVGDLAAFTAEPPSKFKDFARYHLPLTPPAEMAFLLAEEEVPDFNERLGQISQYPALLRSLGFVLDAELILDPGVTLPDDGELAASVASSPLTSQLQIVSPWSAYASAKVSGQRRASMRAGDDDTARRGGFFTIDPKRTRMRQYGLDNAVWGLMKQDKADGEAKTNDVSPGYRTTVRPALQSTGFSLFDERIKEELDAVHARQSDIETQTAALPSGAVDASAPILYARDVERGVRVDVHWSGSNAWHSLSARRHSLFVGQNPAAPLDGFGPSEGMSILALSAGSDGSERTSQRLFGWVGWSLVEPMIGEAADDEGNPRAADIPVVPWRVEEQVRAGTLPKLLYGDRYKFRCRSTDLAGNSWSLRGADAVSPAVVRAETKAEIFQRLEPLPPPKIFSEDKLRAGEKRLLLAVREGAPESWRSVHPPGGSWTLVERHDVLKGLSDATAYGIFQLATTRPGVRDARAVEDKFERYVADPAALGVSVEVFDGEGDSEGYRRTLRFKGGLVRDERESLAIELRRGRYKVSQDDDRIAVTLPIGEARRLVLRTTPRASLRSTFAFDDPSVDDTADHVTPPVDVTLLHATPVPIEAPLLGKPGVQPRERKQTTIAFSDPGLSTHTATTARVVFEAAWTELYDDPAFPDWTRADRSAVIATQEIALDPAHPLAFSAARGADLAATPTDLKALKVARAVGVVAGGDAPSAKFDFQDSRSRRLSVVPHGHTRHAEFFPEHAQLDKPPVTSGAAGAVLVPSTANPTPPGLEYILPIFRRTPTSPSWRERQVVREGWSLRVFLKRDWRAEERLAIVFGRGPQATAFSAIGQDPLVVAKAAMPSLTTAHIAGPVINSLNLPRNDAYLETGAAADADIIDAVTFEVGYDPIKNLRFADIHLRLPQKTMQPFVRLALARYNPDSIAGAELSKMWMADWAQPAPDRVVNVLRQPGGSRLIKVICDAADDSSERPPGGPATTAGVSRTRFVAHVEYTELYYDGEYAWDPVPNSEVELTQDPTAAQPTWTATIDPRHATLLGRRRIVVREFLKLSAHGCEPADADTLRLMALEIVDF